MERTPANSPPVSVLAPPYKRLERFVWGGGGPSRPREPGTCLVWQMGLGSWSRIFELARRRPPGVALILVLPPTVEAKSAPLLLRIVEVCRPHSILPFHPEPHVEDLISLLRREPEDLPIEVIDYLQWRGIDVEIETRRLLRKTIELSSELRSVKALARSMYVSRRALGRRFLSRGLPVPSHWLHFGRILRVALRLQNFPRESLSEAAHRFGYRDGFAVSNQMYRLVGVRPSDARRYHGWEWFVEAWLAAEKARGSFSTKVSSTFSATG